MEFYLKVKWQILQVLNSNLPSYTCMKDVSLNGVMQEAKSSPIENTQMITYKVFSATEAPTTFIDSIV